MIHSFMTFSVVLLSLEMLDTCTKAAFNNNIIYHNDLPELVQLDSIYTIHVKLFGSCR